MNDCSEEIQAYVKEVTQDIATEIKSELREVISKVDNALENTDQLDMSSYQQQHNITSAADELKSRDSVSATDVAEYLKEYSKEMASEVKSEIRELCMDLHFETPPTSSSSCALTESPSSSRKNSPPEIEALKRGGMAAGRRMQPPSVLNLQQRLSDIAWQDDGCRRDHHDTRTNRSESFPCRPQASQEWQAQTRQSTRSSATSGVTSPKYTGAISKLADTSETASRDSGINMCFGEAEGNQPSWPR